MPRKPFRIKTNYKPGSKAEVDLIDRSIREGWMFSRPDQLMAARDRLAQIALTSKDRTAVQACRALLTLREQDLKIAGQLPPDQTQVIEIEFVNEDQAQATLAAPATDPCEPGQEQAISHGETLREDGSGGPAPHPQEPPKAG